MSGIGSRWSEPVPADRVVPGTTVLHKGAVFEMGVSSLQGTGDDAVWFYALESPSERRLIGGLDLVQEWAKEPAPRPTPRRDIVVPSPEDIRNLKSWAADEAGGAPTSELRDRAVTILALIAWWERR